VSLSNIEFLIQEAFTGIRRNGLMAFASISTIALSLGILGSFVLIALGANHFAASQIGKFQIGVYMVNGATDKKAETVAEKIRKMSGVASVELRSREKEWATFKRQRPDIESSGLPINPLPYAMDVKISDASRTAAIANKIRAIRGIDTVREGRDELSRVMALARVVRGVSIVGVLVLLVTAIFIISNAIKLTLYARRREIRIMKLVGATNWFIRIPLVIEGIVFGSVGAFIAWALLRVGGTYITRAIHGITPFLSDFSSDVRPSQLALVLVVLGAVIGAAGSFVSIRRFLHD